jgi:hypothetical protein
VQVIWVHRGHELRARYKRRQQAADRRLRAQHQRPHHADGGRVHDQSRPASLVAQNWGKGAAAAAGDEMWPGSRDGDGAEGP